MKKINPSPLLAIGRGNPYERHKMAGTITQNGITIRQGDSFQINVKIGCQCGCAPVDITNTELLMQVRNKDGGLMFSVVGTVVDAEKGEMQINLTPEYTNIPVGDYETDIQLKTDDGSVNTIYPENIHQVAFFRITEQVTRNENN